MLTMAKARREGKLLPGQPEPSVRKAHLARHTPEAVTRQYLDVIEQAISRRSNRGRK